MVEAAVVRPIEVGSGDGECAKHIARTGRADATGKFEGDDGFDGRLDADALGEVEFDGGKGNTAAGDSGGAATGHGVFVALLGVGGVMRHTEARGEDGKGLAGAAVGAFGATMDGFEFGLAAGGVGCGLDGRFRAPTDGDAGSGGIGQDTGAGGGVFCFKIFQSSQTFLDREFCLLNKEGRTPAMTTCEMPGVAPSPPGPPLPTSRARGRTSWLDTMALG